MKEENKELLMLGIEELEPRIEMAVIPTFSLRDINANVLADCGTTNTNCAGANCVAGCGS